MFWKGFNALKAVNAIQKTDLNVLGEGDNTLDAMDAFMNNDCFCPQS